MKINKNKLECCMVRAEIYTMAALAKIVGVSPQAMSAIKQRGTCRVETAGKIARALGVDVAEITEDVKQ